MREEGPNRNKKNEVF